MAETNVAEPDGVETKESELVETETDGDETDLTQKNQIKGTETIKAKTNRKPF